MNNGKGMVIVILTQGGLNISRLKSLASLM